MLILEFHNVKIAGNRVTQHFHVESKIQSMSSATDPTNQKIIMNSVGAVRLMKK